MIKEVYGDVFSQGANIICHQVNCKGVMGAGIAVTVKKMIGKQSYEVYQSLCKQNGSKLLGSVFYTPVSDSVLIANCFGQDNCGHGLQTDYEALKKCLENVFQYASKHNLIVALPGLIGCGLAGGDWNYVKREIINPLFASCDTQLIIAYFNEADYKKYTQ